MRIRGTFGTGGTSAHQPSESSDSIRHLRTTFGAMVVNVNKRSVSADARAFTQNYLLVLDLGADLLINLILNAQSKVKSQTDSNDNLLVNSLKI